MPVTFQVVGNLADFGNNARAGVKVRATASPGVKVGDVAVHSNEPETVVTDSTGAFTLELVSLPGVWYRIQTPYGGALTTVNLAGYVPDVDDPTTGTALPGGTVINLIDVVNENPTPGYEAVAFSTPATWAALPDKPTLGTAATAATTDFATAAQGALATTTAARGKPLNGSRWLIVGDSLSILGTTGIQGQSYTTFLPWSSGGRLREVARTAASGNTSAQQLTAVRALIAANVAQPTLATILVGTNDLGTGVTQATWQANVTALTQELRTAGCESVLFTLPPRSGPTAPIAPAVVNQWNAWLRKYARENGFALVDLWRVVTNPATGEWKTGWFDTSDGVHGNAVAMKAIADEAALVLTPLLLPASLIETRTLFDGNLLSDGIFTSTTVPASWTKAGNGWTAVADAAAPGGFAVQLSSDVNPATRPDFQKLATITAGEQHRYLCTVTFRVVSSVDVAAGAGMRLSILENAATPATTWALTLFGQNLPTAGYMTHQFEFTPTATTNGIRPYIQYVKGTSAVTNQIVARIAAFGLYDLTALGLA